MPHGPAIDVSPGLNGRVVPYPRGKVVGGSSVINALAYQRGHPAAYDRWPEGWRHLDLLPYFKRQDVFRRRQRLAWRRRSSARSLGIPVAVDQPDVGRHLEDHPLVAGVAYKARREMPRSHYNHADALLYVLQRTPDASPELLVMCLSLPFVLPTVGPLAAPAYVLVPCLMQPRSRGSVRLASDNPRDPALIDPIYLSEPADLRILAEGVALARDIGAGTAFAEWRAEEIYPGPGWANIATQHDFIRRAANSFHHPVGTCGIGRVVERPCASRALRVCASLTPRCCPAFRRR